MKPKFTALAFFVVGWLAFSLPVQALELQDVRVVGLFSNAAVVKINGKQRLLRVGQTSPEGVELLSADARVATLLIAGKQYQLGLSRDHSGGYQERQVVSAQISIDEKFSTRFIKEIFSILLK